MPITAQIALIESIESREADKDLVLLVSVERNAFVIVFNKNILFVGCMLYSLHLIDMGSFKFCAVCFLVILYLTIQGSCFSRHLKRQL